MIISEEVKKIQDEYHVIGREFELKLLLIALKAKKNIILEGLVGTGKTYLAQAISQYRDSNFVRIDGSEDVFAHTLVGYFDPPAIMKDGYVENSFVMGPLSNSMEKGGCFFINELNRLPEQTQNVLLSALDEKKIIIPKLKTIEANSSFICIATQNPEAHVGVSSLGEALKDRFVWIEVSYQSEKEETAIINQNLDTKSEFYDEIIAEITVKIVRATREYPEIRRGASIRAGVDLAQLIIQSGNVEGRSTWKHLALMSIKPKIEILEGSVKNAKEIISDIVDSVLDHFQ